MIACLDGGTGPGRESRGGGTGGGSDRGDSASGPGQVGAGARRPSRRRAADDRWEPPAWSARFRIHPEAPKPNAFLDALDDRRIAQVLERKREAREGGIAALQAELRARGMPAERIVAAIMYDGERAPKSTNRAQLAIIGIDPPRASSAIDALDPADCARELWRAIYGLASLGIFLLGTDHLDDRRLLAFLSTRVLEEEILDIPPIEEMSEFIDLGTVSQADEAFATLRGDATLREEPTGLVAIHEPVEPQAALAEGVGFEIGPVPMFGYPEAVRRHPRVVSRDHLLPRPDREYDGDDAPTTTGGAA